VQTLTWQKSTYSPDGSNCVYVAADLTGTVYLRESDAPDAILTTSPEALRDLTRALKHLWIRPVHDSRIRTDPA
jgi:Domain of unknown function (DUF397)